MKSKFLFVLIFLILINISLVSATFSENKTIKVNEIINFKGIGIKLIDVGSKGSAMLNVGGFSTRIALHGKENFEVFGIELIVLDSFYLTGQKEERYIKLSITQTAECLVNEDCKTDNPCGHDLCSVKKCYHGRKKGCILGDECVEYGTVHENSYCYDNAWIAQKDTDEPCEEDYECKGGYCNEICIRTVPYEAEGGERKMAPAWILIVIGALIAIEALFCIFIPKKIKRIGERFYRLISNLGLRIIGIALLIIAILLIIWAI